MINKRIKLFFAALVISLVNIPVGESLAQTLPGFAEKRISYADFITKVGKNNPGYIAEKFNVNIADAQVLSAGIFPDPELSAGWFDHGERRMEMGYGFHTELSWTLELGGKRKARVDLAKSEYELSKHLLENYFQNLRADATIHFLQAIQNQKLLEVQLSSYKTMRELALSDSIRYSLGSITRVDVRQSKLEAGTMYNEVIQAEAELKISLAGLSVFLGSHHADTLWLPEGDFQSLERHYSLAELITASQNNRADLLAALQHKDVSRNLVRLAQANRVIDLGLFGSIEHATDARNETAPTPAHTTVSAGITIPLKFSNLRPGELKSAHFANQQAEAQYSQIEMEIRNEVTQAYLYYMALQKQVKQFNDGLLTEAKAVLDGKIYSYQRGETSLLEVLNAQRTFNEVQQSYYQTLFRHAEALVELQRVAGIWDIFL
jgi:cobalt-zinc-cadmium efflux system outer membrane protein